MMLDVHCTAPFRLIQARGRRAGKRKGSNKYQKKPALCPSVTSIKHAPVAGALLSLSRFLPMLTPTAHTLLCAAALKGGSRSLLPTQGAACSPLYNCSLVFDLNPCRQRHRTCGMQPKQR